MNDEESEGRDSPVDAPDEFDESSFRLTGNLGRRIDGVWVAEADELLTRSDLAPVAKLILMLLLLCVKDRASEVHFRPCKDEADAPVYQLWYVVQDQSYPLVPPPLALAPGIAAALKRLAGLTSLRARLAGGLRHVADRLDGQPPRPTVGTFRLQWGPHSTPIQARFYPTESGDWCVLAFEAFDEPHSTAAQQIFDRLRKLRRKEGRATAPPPEV